MSLFSRDALGRLVPVNPGLPVRRGNQGGMGRVLSEAELMASLPDADIAGAIGPGVVPGGEQAIGARRQTLVTEAAPAPAPTFRPLAGAQQNNRGNVRIVPLATFAGQAELTVPSIVETPKTTGDDAEAMAIQLSMDLPAQLQDTASGYANTPIDVIAIVEWGVGGAFFSAEIDWNQGTSFTICASFVRVSARVGAIGALALPDLTMVLRASIAYGNPMSLSISSPVRRTLEVVPPFYMEAGAQSAVFAIPLWSLGFTLTDGGVEFLGAAPPDYTISLFDNLAGGPATVMYRVTSRTNQGTQVEGQFPIPRNSRFIVVTNNLGSRTVSPKLLFNLGL